MLSSTTSDTPVRGDVWIVNWPTTPCACAAQTSLREERRLSPEKHVTFRKKADRRRLRTVILDLMYQAARWVRHWRRFGLSFGCFNPWFDVWRRTYLRVCA